MTKDKYDTSKDIGTYMYLAYNTGSLEIPPTTGLLFVVVEKKDF